MLAVAFPPTHSQRTLAASVPVGLLEESCPESGFARVLPKISAQQYQVCALDRLLKTCVDWSQALAGAVAMLAAGTTLSGAKSRR